MSTPFLELFNEYERDLLAEAVEHFRRHCKSHRHRRIDTCNVKSVSKIQTWSDKLREIEKIQQKISTESF